jgi:hypothetical protein
MINEFDSEFDDVFVRLRELGDGEVLRRMRQAARRGSTDVLYLRPHLAAERAIL